MLSLMLLRHAKSSWKYPYLQDYERPLNKRGKKTAPFMGKFMVENDLLPDLILCSTATRALQTCRRALGAIDQEIPVKKLESLYLSDPTTLIDLIQTHGKKSKKLLVIAHNPGLEELIEVLTSDDEFLPTAALALLDIPITSWQKLRLKSRAKLRQLYRPRELMEDPLSHLPTSSGKTPKHPTESIKN